GDLDLAVEHHEQFAARGALLKNDVADTKLVDAFLDRHGSPLPGPGQRHHVNREIPVSKRSLPPKGPSPQGNRAGMAAVSATRGPRKRPKSAPDNSRKLRKSGPQSGRG